MCDRSEVSAQEKDSLYIRKKAAAHTVVNDRKTARLAFPERIVYMSSTSVKCYHGGLRGARVDRSLLCAQKIK